MFWQFYQERGFIFIFSLEQVPHTLSLPTLNNSTAEKWSFIFLTGSTGLPWFCLIFETDAIFTSPSQKHYIKCHLSNGSQTFTPHFIIIWLRSRTQNLWELQGQKLHPQESPSAREVRNSSVGRKTHRWKIWKRSPGWSAGDQPCCCWSHTERAMPIHSHQVSSWGWWCTFLLEHKQEFAMRKTVGLVGGFIPTGNEGWVLDVL